MLCSSAVPAFAWGGKGHRIINAAAARAFPATLPDFTRSNDAAIEIERLGPELDRLKDAGHVWDAEHDVAHFIDIGDDGTVDGIVLTALPPTREGFDSALRAKNTTQYKQGYLPYSLADGWEELRKEFALWRDDVANAQKAPNPSALLEAQRWKVVDEASILHTIGVWGHFVGDASQPLHVTVHYNGWGNYSNPEHFTSNDHLHAFFESEFVNANVDEAKVVAKVAPLNDCAATGAPLDDAHVMSMMTSYLGASAATVPALYRIEQRQGFQNATPEAVGFAEERLAFGASELRDLVVCAWENSANVRIYRE